MKRSVSSVEGGVSAIPASTVQKSAALRHDHKKIRAAAIALVREEDMEDLILTLRDYEKNYNNEKHRDILIFSETEWSPQAWKKLTTSCESKIYFHLIDEEAWGVPDHIDKERFHQVLTEREYYGNTENYRKMCRFFAGKLWQLPVIKKYDYIWRLDSHVRFLCPFTFDPFEALENSHAIYGYTIPSVEAPHTVPTLFKTVIDYARSRGRLDHLREYWGVTPESEMPNMCHFWNNFEIVKVSFTTSEEYQDYFNYIEQVGGIFYERWGDAPIRTFGVMLYARPQDVILFDNIGYQHPWAHSCPYNIDGGKCPGGFGYCNPDPDIQPHRFNPRNDCRIGT